MPHFPHLRGIAVFVVILLIGVGLGALVTFSLINQNKNADKKKTMEVVATGSVKVPATDMNFNATYNGSETYATQQKAQSFADTIKKKASDEIAKANLTAITFQVNSYASPIAGGDYYYKEPQPNPSGPVPFPLPQDYSYSATVSVNAIIKNDQKGAYQKAKSALENIGFTVDQPYYIAYSSPEVQSKAREEAMKDANRQVVDFKNIDLRIGKVIEIKDLSAPNTKDIGGYYPQPTALPVDYGKDYGTLSVSYKITYELK